MKVVTTAGTVRALILLAVTGLVTLLVVVPGYREVPVRWTVSDLDRLDTQLATAGCRLAPIETALSAGEVAAHWRLGAMTEGAGFYVRNQRTGQAGVFGIADGGGEGSLRIYGDRFVVASADGKPLLHRRLRDWELFAVVPPGTEPDLTRQAVPRFELADGFMRTELGEGDGWRVRSGKWGLKQYGGGLARTEHEQESSGFQRAVNPFSVVGRGGDGDAGVMEMVRSAGYGDGGLAEARFFLGEPHAGETADAGVSTEVPRFLITQGAVDGHLVGFGWWTMGPDAVPAWRLVVRDGTGADGQWRLLGEWRERPPVSNWIRVGLAVADGHVAMPMLDGVALARVPLDFMVAGNAHLRVAAGEAVEFDDVLIGPWPAPTGAIGNPVLVRSSGFADKQEIDYRDSAQFGEWARGEKALVIHERGNQALGIEGAYAVVRYPFFGDLSYRSDPAAAIGTHRLLLATAADPTAEEVVWEVRAERREDGWVLNDGDEPGFGLEVGRRDGRLFAAVDGVEKARREVGSEALYLVLAPPSRRGLSPGRLHLRSATIWHDLFEGAPTAWTWPDGRFGMNVRWACQPGWNFMAGKSIDLAAMHSKHAYHGDQVIDAFTSLCFTLPSSDEYYVRRDLCVSFCTDGRNLNSGYTLIFGGENNTQTMLLKRGEIIASTQAAEFLFPTAYSHNAVHWLWWNFEIHKVGREVRVLLNGKEMLRADDPEPLAGGHVAYWTVGNGFVLSRMTVAAESRTLAPERTRAAWGGAAMAGWEPLRADAVALAPVGEGVVVRNVVAGGSMAVRRKMTVDLAKTPTLRLPAWLGDGTKANLHLEIGGRSYLVRLNGPLEKMPRLLTPQWERAIGFTRDMLSEAVVRKSLLGAAMPEGGELRLCLSDLLKARGEPVPSGETSVVLTIGNSSNAGYLMAGFGGNGAGAEYWVGEPVWQ